jgi:hypothetical protein
MENELDFQVLIASNEQVVDAYPEIFEKLSIDIMPIYIEKNYEEIDHSTDPRIILLPSGIISVSSKENQDFIWGNYQTEKYINFLVELNKKTRDWSMKNSKKNMLSYEEIIDGKEYIISFFAYKDIDTNKTLIDTIDEKLKVPKSQGKLKE